MLAELIDLLREREFALVAVDGFAGAGKSTFTAALSTGLDQPMQVISADEFVGPEQRDWRKWTPRQGYERYLDHVLLERDVLQPLRAGRPGRYRRYDWTRRQPGGIVEVAPAGVVVVEGVFLLRDRLRGYWDASIWVDVPVEVRGRRLDERGGADAGWIEGLDARRGILRARRSAAPARRLHRQQWQLTAR